MSDTDLAQAIDIPMEVALLPLQNFLVYPLMVAPLAVGQAASVRLIDDGMLGERLVALVTLRSDQRPAQPAAADLYTIGTLALVHRLLRLPDGTLRVAIQGVERVRIDEITQTVPYLRAKISLYGEEVGDRDEVQALMHQVQHLSRHMLHFLPAPGEELAAQIADETNPRRLAYCVASSLLFRSTIGERQRLLEAPTVHDTLARLHDILSRDLAMLQAGQDVQPQAVPIAEQPVPASDTEQANTIRRVVPNMQVTNLAASEQFYTQVLGFTKVMDLGWIATFAAPNDPAVQVTLLANDPSGLHPSVSIEVEDVDAAHAAAVAQGHPIVYPLTDEPWGVRRFFARDPNGAIINVLSHQ